MKRPQPKFPATDGETAEEEYRAGITEDIRPWGKFRRFPHEDAAAVKIITVGPGGTLSLQSHARRSEFWVVLDPGLEITLGETVWRPRPDEEIFIPRETAHRLRNPGDSPARVMEIWIGDSDETDITRIEDKYGRE
jgi:mannose-6-phosphate isomerase-like protein (cupin superfamily)